jgi:hypothetical protein
MIMRFIKSLILLLVFITLYVVLSNDDYQKDIENTANNCYNRQNSTKGNPC